MLPLHDEVPFISTYQKQANIFAILPGSHAIINSVALQMFSVIRWSASITLALLRDGFFGVFPIRYLLAPKIEKQNSFAISSEVFGITRSSSNKISCSVSLLMSTMLEADILSNEKESWERERAPVPSTGKKIFKGRVP
jgi:hypothetical protein